MFTKSVRRRKSQYPMCQCLFLSKISQEFRDCYRFCWLLVVAAAIVLFTVQVGMRFYAYYEYRSNVGVKIKFVDSIPFPAVTM